MARTRSSRRGSEERERERVAGRVQSERASGTEMREKEKREGR
jgi:hypothetical protein